MPDPTLDLKSSVTDWIAAFNRAKGWETLRKNPVVPKATDLRSSPDRQLAGEMAARLAGDDKQALTDAISKDDIALKDLERRVAAAQPGDDIDALQVQLEQLRAGLSEQRANLAIVERIEKRLARLVMMEGNLPDDLKKVRKDNVALRDRAAEAGFDPAALDQKQLAGFRRAHVDMQKNIDNARAEVMTITTDKTGKTRSYAIINGKEYKVLYGLLEQSLLVLQTEGVERAYQKILEVQTLLGNYRSARTGGTVNTAPPSPIEGSGLDGPFRNARDLIDGIRQRGLDATATALQTARDDLYRDVEAAVLAKEDGIREGYLDLIEVIVSGAQRARDDAVAIQSVLAGVNTDIATLVANGHRVDDERTLVADFLKDAAAQSQTSITVGRAHELATEIRQRLKDATDADLALEGLDRDDMRADVEELAGRFGTFFSHNIFTGKIRTQTDTKSQEKKNVRANKDIPRAALDEIELQLMAARQLLDSDSVEALRTADDYLQGVNTFVTTIENDPKVYSHLEDGFKKVETAIKKLESDYRLYLPGDRLDLMAKLTDLRDGQYTRPQDTVNRDTEKLAEKVEALGTEVRSLQVRKRALATRADAVDDLIKNIGKVLKGKKAFVDLDGYYGPEIGQMMQVRDQIAERTEQSLSNAETDIISMQAKLLLALDSARNWAAKKGLDDAGISALDTLLSEARQGQTAHDADEAAKTDFESAVKTLGGDIASVKKMLEKLKADPGEILTLEAKRTALKADVGKTGKFKAGLEEAKALKSRVNQVHDDTESAAAVLDAGLAQAAAACVHMVDGFVTKLDTFVADAILPAGQTDGSNEFDTFDKDKIMSFFTKLAQAVRGTGTDALKTNAAIVADRSAGIPARKKAREAALSELRKLMALFDSFQPMLHFRSHPFSTGDASTRAASARQAMPRLEMRLLTAIKD
ncbi:hypothetical protein [Szabonella alba]|uniref:Uncharacterized protein n=1 Tax=Szabonella alba TaxID=2804194 RepID=A0A8K0V5M7_9RHOB|nr:hypothetical protein [Szabonella alba]MBL4915611.1 hypothetical protein [Szabonella alba]